MPLVLVHGSNHTGMTYETTPDGREGWATWFVRQGHPVYVVDHSGRGRSGFNPTPVNAVRDGGADPKTLPTFFLGPIDRAWWNFRFGPDYPKPFPGLQFPLEALDQYLAQLVPNSETTLAGGGANTVDALAALLDRIGPAVVMVHSQSGVYGLDVVRKRPNLVRALVSVEGGCETFTPADIDAVREGAVRLRVGRQQRRRERRQRRQAARGLRAGGQPDQGRRRARERCWCCPKPASGETVT